MDHSAVSPDDETERKSGERRRESHDSPVLTWRTGTLYLLVIAVLAYWTSYSEGVVSATSFHSLSPPINITFVLFMTAALVVPFHRWIIRKRIAAQVALLLILAPILRGFATLALLMIGNVLPGVHRALPNGLSFQNSLILALLLYMPLKRKLERIQPFDAREMIALYAMLMTGTLCTGYAVVQFLTPTLVSARYFKTPENRWEELFFRFIPSWFGVNDMRAIKSFWEGGTDNIYWSLWIRPLASWLVFSLIAMWTMYCLASLVQRQWIDRERLSFPLTYLPLEMAHQEPNQTFGPLFRNPILWIGFGVPVILHLFNGLNVYYPAVPTLNFRHINVTENLTYPPWNAIGGLDVTFYPLLVGFTYLLTLDLSFSVWFFFLLRKMEPVFARAFGWSEWLSPSGKTFPFIDQQDTGAFVALVFMSAWTGRRALLETLNRAWKPERMTNPDETLSDRAIVGGIAIGIISLCGWSFIAGMGVLPALAFFALFFFWCIAISRIRAEAGLGGLTGPMTPQETMILLTGSRAYAPSSLTVLAYYRWFATDLRALASLMPAQLEDIRMIRAVGLSPKSLGVAVMFASAVASVFAFVLYLPIIYRYGGVNMNGQRFLDVPVYPFRELASNLASPKPADWAASLAVFIGLGFTMMLSAMRLRYAWWPFHPIGFAVGFSRRTIEWMWFSVFLGWLCKGAILRAGGLKAYRKALPLFLGFILGEFAMGVLYGIVGTINPGASGYQLYP